MTVFDRWPVDLVRITQDWAVSNTWENPPWHKGIDIGGTEATAIKAPCDMFIVHAGFQAFAFGNTWEQIPGSRNSGGCIIGQPPAPHTAFQTSFSHLSKILVVPGQWVRSGEIIGYMGTTGNSSGVHLHWECFIDYAEGVYPAGTFYGRVDPKAYFKTVTKVPYSPGGKGSTLIQEEDVTTPAQIDEIVNRVLKGVNGYTAAMSLNGYKIGDKHYPGIIPRLEALPGQIAGIKITGRPGGPVSWLQDNANATSGVERLELRLAAMQEVIGELAQNSNVTPEQINQMIDTAVERTAATFADNKIEVRVVNENPATPTGAATPEETQ